MPGNSPRRGATRKRQGGNPTAGSGARRRKQLEGQGPTPKAEDRPNHKAYQRKRPADRTSKGPGAAGAQVGPGGQGNRVSGRTRKPDSIEWVAGRNAVLEALAAAIPASVLHVAERTERDDRLRDSLELAVRHGIPVLESSRRELDRLTDGTLHQGIALKVPPYAYADVEDLVESARERGDLPRLVVLDKITDPRNLGAIVRSAAAFGAHGVVIPERRSASMTASAWKSSAGAATRVRVARVTNLTRQLNDLKDDGFVVVGLDASGDGAVSDVDVDTPLALVVGAEGGGLSRLVRETCDVLTRIPMQTGAESLNAGVAASVALYDIARRTG